MPNFWSSAAQRVNEIFIGPRTSDKEWNLQHERFKQSFRKIDPIRNIYENFNEQTKGFRNLCHDIYTYLPPMYEESSPFKSSISDLTNLYKEIEISYRELISRVGEIKSISTQWDFDIESTNKMINERAEQRRIYDHYDAKIEGLLKKRRPENASKEELARLERNETKLKEAIKKYSQLSFDSFYKMQHLIEYRENYVNQTVMKFTLDLKLFFDKVSSLLMANETLQEQFKKIQMSRLESHEDLYDPFRCIKDRGLDLTDLNVFMRKKQVLLKENIIVNEDKQEKERSENIGLIRPVSPQNTELLAERNGNIELIEPVSPQNTDKIIPVAKESNTLVQLKPVEEKNKLPETSDSIVNLVPAYETMDNRKHSNNIKHIELPSENFCFVPLEEEEKIIEQGPSSVIESELVPSFRPSEIVEYHSQKEEEKLEEGEKSPSHSVIQQSKGLFGKDVHKRQHSPASTKVKPSYIKYSNKKDKKKNSVEIDSNKKYIH